MLNYKGVKKREESLKSQRWHKYSQPTWTKVVFCIYKKVHRKRLWQLRRPFMISSLQPHFLATLPQLLSCWTTCSSQHVPCPCMPPGLCLYLHIPFFGLANSCLRNTSISRSKVLRCAAIAWFTEMVPWLFQCSMRECNIGEKEFYFHPFQWLRQ